MNATDALRKIDALRAKAHSTTFPAEAVALNAKADQLAAKYNVNENAPRFNVDDLFNRPRSERTYRASKTTVTVDFVFSTNDWSLPGKRRLTDVIAQATGCSVRFAPTDKYNHHDQHVFVSCYGDNPQANVDRFIAMHMRAMRVATDAASKETRSAKRTWSAFLNGFADGVGARHGVFSYGTGRRGNGDGSAWAAGYDAGKRSAL